MALNPFNAGLPEGPGSGHFGEINCADCPAIELPPHPALFFSFFLTDFSRLFFAWVFIFLRPTLGHIIRSGQLNSWTAEKLKANWKISMAKLLHEHRVCYGMPAWTSSLPFDGLWLAGLSIQAPESRILEAITRHLQCVRVSEFPCPSLLPLSSCMKLNPFYEQECKRFRSAILNL